MARRPLSPHLFIYRRGYTMSLSILHRATGIALSVVLVVAAAVLVAAASGPEAWERFTGLLPGAAWRWLLAAPALLAFVYHLCAGIRHLCWDAGYGYERREARASAKLLIAAVVLLGGLALYALSRAGGAA